MVVEAGAYRFSPNKTSIIIGNWTWTIYTPVTAHLVMDALGLRTKRYNPLAGQFDSNLLKIVDAEGYDAGYLSFVEALHSRAEEVSNFRFFSGHELVSVVSDGEDKPLRLMFANGATASVGKLVLNMPQRPLLRVLAASPTLLQGAPWPSVLAAPTAYPIAKLYLHYDDAWWRNDLGLISGHFNNSEAWKVTTGLSPMAADDCLASKQTPLPLQGSYHDADVRCDLPGGKCRGFLQTAYMGDLQAVRAFEAFHLSGNDSVVELTPERPDHAHLLDLLHTGLVELHAEQLAAANATDRVKALRPTGGVLSIWSMRVAGLEAGCHIPKDGPPLPAKEVPQRALQPLADERVLIANEAFGPLECWAEGSLIMAENVAYKLGLPKPAWLPQSVYEETIFKAGAPRPSHHQNVPSDLRLAAAGV